MSSRRSERARKRPLSIDTQHATPSLTSLATTSFQKPTETDFRETAFDRLAGEENGVNGLTEVSLETLGRSVGRTKGGSVRSSAGKRTRTAAALSGITRNKENGGDTIQQHEQDSEVVLQHQQQQAVNGAQSFVGDEQDHAELQEESEKEDEEEEDEEDPVWQEFSQEYYEVVEQLPLEIHRNFALLRELDDQTQRQTRQLLEILRKYVAQRLPSPVPEGLQKPLPILQPDAMTATVVTTPGQGEEGVKKEEQMSTGNGGKALQATEQRMDVDVNVTHDTALSVEKENGEIDTTQVQARTQAGSQEKSEMSKSQPEINPEPGQEESVLPADEQGAQEKTHLNGSDLPENSKDARSVTGDLGSTTSIPVATSGDVSLANAPCKTNGNPLEAQGVNGHPTESIPPPLTTTTTTTTTVDQRSMSTDANPPPPPPSTAEGTQQMQLLKARHAQMYAHDLVPAMASRALLPEIGKLAREMLRSADEKVGIAMGTYNTVDRHIRSLDAALQAQQAALNLGIRQDTLPSTAITGATITADDSEPPAESMLQAGGRADAGGDLVLGASGNGDHEQGLKRVGKNWRKGIKGAGGGAAARAADALNIGVSSSAVHFSVNPTSAAQGDVQGAAGTGAISSKQRGKQKAEPKPIVLGYMAAHKFDMKIDPNEPRYCFCHQVSFGEMLGCENNDCPNGGWFHLSCLGMTKPPAGKWWCDSCKPKDKGSGQKRKKRKIKF